MRSANSAIERASNVMSCENESPGFTARAGGVVAIRRNYETSHSRSCRERLIVSLVPASAVAKRVTIDRIEDSPIGEEVEVVGYF